MTAPPPPEPPAPRRLRLAALAVVAAALIVAGGWKLFRPEPGLTMVSRYLPSPRAARAGGCLEIALGLWLLSGRSPKLAPTVAAGAFVGLGLLIGSELRRERPLPCGCFPSRTAVTDTAAVRRQLSVALGQDAFLAVVCGLAAVAMPEKSDEG